MKIAYFRDKVIDDDMYKKLFGDEEVKLDNNSIKLSRAIESLSGNENILDFSHNFLTNIKLFLE